MRTITTFVYTKTAVTVARQDKGLTWWAVSQARPVGVAMNRLFVYGIFLGEERRRNYGMSNPKYSTVKGFVTAGEHIVEAVRVDIEQLALTGLTVDVDPAYWTRIDALEYGYDRILVETTMGEEVYMYAQKGTI